MHYICQRFKKKPDFCRNATMADAKKKTNPWHEIFKTVQN